MARLPTLSGLKAVCRYANRQQNNDYLPTCFLFFLPATCLIVLFFSFFSILGTLYHGVVQTSGTADGIGKRWESCQARFHANLQRTTAQRAQELPDQITRHKRRSRIDTPNRRFGARADHWAQSRPDFRWCGVVCPTGGRTPALGTGAAVRPRLR